MTPSDLLLALTFGVAFTTFTCFISRVLFLSHKKRDRNNTDRGKILPVVKGHRDLAIGLDRSSLAQTVSLTNAPAKPQYRQWIDVNDIITDKVIYFDHS